MSASSLTGAAVAALEGVQQRSASTRNAVLAATSLPDPAEALWEVRAVALAALEQSWESAAGVYGDLLSSDLRRPDSDPLVAAALRGLHEESTWLRALAALADRELTAGVPAGRTRAFIGELGTAFSSIG